MNKNRHPKAAVYSERRIDVVVSWLWPDRATPKHYHKETAFSQLNDELICCPPSCQSMKIEIF